MPSNYNSPEDFYDDALNRKEKPDILNPRSRPDESQYYGPRKPKTTTLEYVGRKFNPSEITQYAREMPGGSWSTYSEPTPYTLEGRRGEELTSDDLRYPLRQTELKPRYQPLSTGGEIPSYYPGEQDIAQKTNTSPIVYDNSIFMPRSNTSAYTNTQDMVFQEYGNIPAGGTNQQSTTSPIVFSPSTWHTYQGTEWRKGPTEDKPIIFNDNIWYGPKMQQDVLKPPYIQKMIEYEYKRKSNYKPPKVNPEDSAPPRTNTNIYNNIVPENAQLPRVPRTSYAPQYNRYVKSFENSDIVYYDINQFEPYEPNKVTKKIDLVQYTPEEIGNLHLKKDYLKVYNYDVKNKGGKIGGVLKAPEKEMQIFDGFLNALASDPVISQYIDNKDNKLRVSDSYRSIKEQEDLKRKKGDLAAEPGKSQHNIARAIDINLEDIIDRELKSKFNYGLTDISNMKKGSEAWNLLKTYIDEETLKYITTPSNAYTRRFRTALVLSDVYARVRDIAKDHQMYNPFEKSAHAGTSTKPELWHWQIGHNPNQSLKKQGGGTTQPKKQPKKQPKVPYV